MKNMSPIMLAGFIAGWVATAALAAFIAIHFATAAPSTPSSPPAQAATQIVTQTAAPAPGPATPAPRLAAPAPAPAAPPPTVPAPATPRPAAPATSATMVAAAAPAAAAPSDAVARLLAARAQEQAETAAAEAAAGAAPAAVGTTVGTISSVPVQRAPSAVAPAATVPVVLAPAPMAATAAAAPAPTISYAVAASGETEQGVKLELRNVTVDAALRFLTEKAGFTIIRNTSTSAASLPPGTVDVVSETPLNKDELVALFNKVLSSKDLTAIQDKKTLTIMTIEDAQKNALTPVNINTNYEGIPADAQVVTEIIPVHTLNPKQVVTDLYTLIPPGAVMNTSDAGNSVIMTASQADIRRFAQIIEALDSTGNGDLEVFLLSYADSKAIAQELKDVFTADNSGGGGGGGGIMTLLGGGGGRGGRGGGAAGGGGGDTRRTGVHINAVSDDENNAVLVSAPLDYMPGISNIIMKLDIPQEDTIIIKLFTLQNADCNDITAELLALFPDPSTGGNAGARGARGNTMQLAGGRGGGARGGAGSSGMSDRQMKQVTVNAVADPRTQSVLVTASKDTMTQIEQIISKMDAMTFGRVQIYTWRPVNGDVGDLIGPLSDLFQQNGRSSSASSTQSALTQRMSQGAQNATTTASTTVTGGNGGGGGGGGGGR